MSNALLAPTSATMESLFQGNLGRVLVITGSNFSGRSELMRTLLRKASEEDKRGILIPPEIHPALSGLTSCVSEELALHIDGTESTEQMGYWRLAGEWGILELANQTPQSLSGGQQAMLAILCKIACRPRILALDGALEQLDPANISRVLGALGSEALFPAPSIAVVSHNALLPEDNVYSSIQAAELIGEISTPPPKLNRDSLVCPAYSDALTMEFRGAGFEYIRNRPVFTGLNLALNPGMVYHLAGPNGAGKSTLARVICGVLQLTRGRVLLNGEQYDLYRKPGQLANMHFQNPDAQFFEDSVEGELRSLHPHTRKLAAEFAGVQDYLHVHPLDLPFVLRKRLSLSITLNSKAPWLIFDEPTIGLDQEAQNEIMRCFEHLANAGRGVIVISHNQRLIDSTASIRRIDLGDFQGR